MTWAFVRDAGIPVSTSGEGEGDRRGEQVERSALHGGRIGELVEVLAGEVDRVAGELAEVRDKPGVVVDGAARPGWFSWCP